MKCKNEQIPLFTEEKNYNYHIDEEAFDLILLYDDIQRRKKFCLKLCKRYFNTCPIGLNHYFSFLCRWERDVVWELEDICPEKYEMLIKESLIEFTPKMRHATKTCNKRDKSQCLPSINL